MLVECVWELVDAGDTGTLPPRFFVRLVSGGRAWRRVPGVGCLGITWREGGDGARARTQVVVRRADRRSNWPADASGNGRGL